HQIYHAKLDSEVRGRGTRILDVLLPRAMADDVIFVDPILHVGAGDVAALLFEQQSGDGAVDSAGHGDENFFASGHETKVRPTRVSCGLSNRAARERANFMKLGSRPGPTQPRIYFHSVCLFA